MIIRLLIIVALTGCTLTGCTLTTNVHMKCDGKCQLDAVRDLKLEKEMKQ